METGDSSWFRNFREVSHQRLRLAARFIIFFFRIRRGDFRDLEHAPILAKRAFSRVRRETDRPLVDAHLPSAEQVWQSARETFRKRDVWPISFSYPRRTAAPAERQGSGLCPTYPGHRYGFSDAAKYLENYGNYDFALTHKKAGWDCFRHVEICYAGAIPYMPDADLIPPHTMVHYPKDFFVRVASHLRAGSAVADEAVKRRFAAYFNRHLTSEAMAKYLTRAAPCLASGKILFVDESAPTMPDYQSILTLIGLKLLYGSKVFVAYPIDYLYSDWVGGGAELYGRGFGYARVLDRALKNENEVSGRDLPLSRTSLQAFGAVVVGSIARNERVSQRLLGLFPPEKTLWIHGEDIGPTPAEIASFRQAGIHAFAREL